MALSTPPAPAPTDAPHGAGAPTATRLVSVDALRGFDMFWILGGDELVQAIHALCGDPVTGCLAHQFDHCDWAGFHIEDLIFPLFVFIAGVSLVFSLSKTIARDGRSVAIRRIIRRGLLLVAFGIVYYGGISHGWDDVRLLGVLQRIGLAYLFAGLLFCVLSTRGLVIACLTVLLGYWGLMAWVPIRDIRLDATTFQQLGEQTGIHDPQVLFARTTARVSGHFEPGYNLANHLDFQYLPGRKWDRYYDPEGLLCTLPAIATCLLGVFAGLLLQNRTIGDRTRLALLIGGGLGLLIIGELWGLEFPVVKKLWTSSFVLVAGGWSLLLLAAFHWSIDLKGWRSWTIPFVWIGMNAIVVYMGENLVHLRGIADRLVGGPLRAILDAHVAQGLGNVVSISATIGLILLCAWFLHRKQIFMRL